MIKVFLQLIIALISCPAFCQAKIEFENLLNVDTLLLDSHEHFTFNFKNTGNEPLIISRCFGDGGSVVAEWPREPIPAGKSGIITARYDTKRFGEINKTITVYSNASVEPVILQLKGFVKVKNKGIGKLEKRNVEILNPERDTVFTFELVNAGDSLMTILSIKNLSYAGAFHPDLKSEKQSLQPGEKTILTFCYSAKESKKEFTRRYGWEIITDACNRHSLRISAVFRYRN